MNHRRSRSDSEIKARDTSSDDESVSDESSSIHTVDLYTGWRLPDFNFSVSIPAWFIMCVTLLLFRGPSQPSCVS